MFHRKSRFMLLLCAAVLGVSGYFHLISAEEDDLFTVVIKNEDEEIASSYMPDADFGEAETKELKTTSTHDDERIDINEEDGDDEWAADRFDQMALSTEFPTIKAKAGHEFLLYGPANVNFTTLYGKVLNTEYTSSCNKDSCKYTFNVKYNPRQRYEKLFYTYQDSEGAFHVWVAN